MNNSEKIILNFVHFFLIFIRNFYSHAYIKLHTVTKKNQYNILHKVKILKTEVEHLIYLALYFFIFTKYMALLSILSYNNYVIALRNHCH